MELSPSAFKFIAQLRCLLGIPLRSWVSTYGAGADAEASCPSSFGPRWNQTETVEFFEIVVRQTTGFRLSVPARGLFAARIGMARVSGSWR